MAGFNIVGCLAILMFASIGVEADCSVEYIQECIAPLMELQSTQAMSEPIFGSPDDLDDICQLAANATECMAPVRDSCTPENLVIWTNLEDTYTYTCTEPGKTLLLNNLDCFGKKDLLQKAVLCNQTYFKSLSDLELESDPKIATTKSCSYLNTYISCSTASIRDICSLEAAEWFLTYTSKMFKGLLDIMTCKVTVTVQNATGAAVTTLASTSLTAAVLLYSIISLSW